MSYIKFSICFSMKFLQANRIASYGILYSAKSHLGLYCLPVSLKDNTRPTWVILDKSFIETSNFNTINTWLI